MKATAYAPLARIASCRTLPAMTGPNEDVFDPDLKPGTILDGRFLVGKRLSRSRMSTIYRGDDLDRDGAGVAIKVPLLQVESDPAGFAQFQREERIGLQLQHPGLLQFFAVRNRRGRPYLVTEFLDGCTLADLLRQTRPLPERDALSIAAAIAEPLARLHKQGIVHRDVKPANVVLCRDGSLRLIDFGQAAPIARKRSVLATLTPLVGTPEYIAPEQIDHQPTDERTDIYSLGAILYEMLTGVVPFQSEDAWKSAYRRTTGDPIAPRRLIPTISAAAEEIVLHALQRAPGARYRSADEFAAELRSPERVVVSGYAEKLESPRWKLSFHGTPLLAGALLGIAALVVLTGLFLALIALKPGR